MENTKMETICGVDCGQCPMHETCKGCKATQGHPFGGDCVAAECCQGRGYGKCAECAACAARAQLMEEVNGLGISDIPPVTELFTLIGAYINLEYPLPGGQTVKFWKDENVYFGAQLPKGDSGRCYGLIADAHHLLISEYGENLADPQIVLFKKR